ncbi:hypothetical protein K1719_039377 [Acacia pycnantha]|nr:hypothetical protein K1719_039377 [Acacia pycnantha]
MEEFRRTGFPGKQKERFLLDGQYLSELLTERASGAVKSKTSRSCIDCFSLWLHHHYSLCCFDSLAHNSYRGY